MHRKDLENQLKATTTEEAAFTWGKHHMPYFKQNVLTVIYELDGNYNSSSQRNWFIFHFL